MYLDLLSRKEKELFLELAYHISMIDGVYAEEEQKTMQVYYNETGINDFALDKNRSIDTIISEMTNICDIKTKKIIIFESIGLAMCDGSYDDNEKTFLSDLTQKIGLTLDYNNQCELFIKEYVDLQNKINNTVIG